MERNVRSIEKNFIFDTNLRIENSFNSDRSFIKNNPILHQKLQTPQAKIRNSSMKNTSLKYFSEKKNIERNFNLNLDFHKKKKKIFDVYNSKKFDELNILKEFYDFKNERIKNFEEDDEVFVKDSSENYFYEENNSIKEKNLAKSINFLEFEKKKKFKLC